jgi:hypothetical protein
MAKDTIRQERLLIVVRVTRRQLSRFPAQGWIAVEVFSDEVTARARFHALRLPLEELKLGAVLVHALVTPSFEQIEYQKTIISKDADFWQLQKSEIARASADQQGQWNEVTGRILDRIDQERVAAEDSAAAKRAAAPARERQQAHRQWGLAAALGFASVFAISVTYGLLARSTGSVDASLDNTRKDVTTVIMADRNDPNQLVEYELKPDGTRKAVRRLSRSEASALSARQDVSDTQAPRHPPKTLVEGLNAFFAVRE